VKKYFLEKKWKKILKKKMKKIFEKKKSKKKSKKIKKMKMAVFDAPRRPLSKTAILISN
jgi:hypothetical protein